MIIEYLLMNKKTKMGLFKKEIFFKRDYGGLQVASPLPVYPAMASAMRFSSMHWLRLMARLSLW